MTNLECILKELNLYHRNRKILLYNYINKRLTESLQSYYSELQDSVNFLNSKEDIRIMSSINKYE